MQLLRPEENGCLSYSKYGTIRVDHSAVKTDKPKAVYVYPADPVEFLRCIQNKLADLQQAIDDQDKEMQRLEAGQQKELNA